MSTCSLLHLVCRCWHLSQHWKPSASSCSLPEPVLTLRSSSILVEENGWTWGASRLTVKLVGSALSVRGLGGQEQGLVVQIAVWGGRFVVRPEFCRAHVAAQGEQRLAQLPCNHWILEGAGSPGGKQGGEGGKKRKCPWLDMLRCLTLTGSFSMPLLTHSLSLYPASPFYGSLITLPLSPAPSLPSSLFYLRLVLPRWYCRLLPGEELLRIAWLYHYTLQS